MSTGPSVSQFNPVLTKETASGLALALTLVAYVPYIFSIIRGQTRPHVFSWVIWGVTTCMVFFAQISDGAGVGAWPIGLSGLTTSLVAILAYKYKGDVSITRMDWLFFVSALAALPVWVAMRDPLWAVVILAIIDVLGFAPTLRNAYSNPYDERVSFYGIYVVRYVFAIYALENYSMTTLLFPIAITASCAVFVVLVIVRRIIIKDKE